MNNRDRCVKGTLKEHEKCACQFIKSNRWPLDTCKCDVCVLGLETMAPETEK